jgi:hypothetical protein
VGLARADGALRGDTTGLGVDACAGVGSAATEADGSAEGGAGGSGGRRCSNRVRSGWKAEFRAEVDR